MTVAERREWAYIASGGVLLLAIRRLIWYPSIRFYFVLGKLEFPGKPTDEQLRFIETVNQVGGLAFVACSVEDVQDRLSFAS